MAACDSVTNHYSTLEEARADRLFERGWLPEMLPPSSYDISTENDLDVSRSKGVFSFTPEEFDPFRERLELVAPLHEWEWGSIAVAVEAHVARGYPVYLHRESDREWIFLCIPERGLCNYYMS
jgi:hypothetical protein